MSKRKKHIMPIKIRFNIWVLTICQPGWIGYSPAANAIRKCCQTERCFWPNWPCSSRINGLVMCTRALLVRQNERVTFNSPSLLQEQNLIIGNTPAVAYSKPNCYFSCSFLAWTNFFPNLSGTAVDWCEDWSSNSCMNDTFHFSNSVSRIPVRFLHMNQSRDLRKHNLWTLMLKSELKME